MLFTLPVSHLVPVGFCWARYSKGRLTLPIPADPSGGSPGKCCISVRAAPCHRPTSHPPTTGSSAPAALSPLLFGGSVTRLSTLHPSPGNSPPSSPVPHTDTDRPHSLCPFRWLLERHHIRKVLWPSSCKSTVPVYCTSLSEYPTPPHRRWDNIVTDYKMTMTFIQFSLWQHNVQSSVYVSSSPNENITPWRQRFPSVMLVCLLLFSFITTGFRILCP